MKKCLNCGTLLTGPYCSRCGQRAQELRVPLRRLLEDAFEDVLQWDSRLLRTLRGLFFRPGFLTLEYLEGRRARYLPPVRLFLISSVVFLLAMSVAKDALVISAAGNGGDASARAGPAVLGVSGLPEGESGPVARLRRGIEEVNRDPQRARELWSHSLTWLAFLMMPIFALLLRWAFRGAGRLYTEHLVFSVHLHSFAFAVTAVTALAAQWTGGAVARFLGRLLLAGLALYLVLALRYVYRQGWARTVVKAAGLAGVFIITTAIFAGLAVVATLFLAA